MGFLVFSNIYEVKTLTVLEIEVCQLEFDTHKLGLNISQVGHYINLSLCGLAAL